MAKRAILDETFACRREQYIDKYEYYCIPWHIYALYSKTTRLVRRLGTRKFLLKRAVRVTTSWHSNNPRCDTKGSLSMKSAYYIAAAAVTCSAILAGRACAAAKGSGKKNILLFYVDDLRWQGFGEIGPQFMKTPNFARLMSVSS